MKFAIGQQVIVNPKSGPMGGHEFMARVINYLEERQVYVVEDQDSDSFEVEEDELELDN